ncbi:MAG: Ig-like domain-containing protein, partial [Acidimicrobiia bacterium]|nr:Ig-like domain-containing protein [Acidimicrobiia bacterium]
MFVLGQGSAQAAVPALRSVGLADNDGPSLTVPVAPGVVAGDVMIAQIGYDKGLATVAPPGGWTFIREDNFTDRTKQTLFYRVATGAEPPNYTFTFSESPKSSGAIAAFSGVDTTNPINAHGGQGLDAPDAFTAPSIDTTVPGTLLVAMFTNRNGAGIDPPGGMSEQWDHFTGDKAASQGSTEEFTGVGGTGPRTASVLAVQKVAQMIALAPAVASDFYLVAGSGGGGGGTDLFTIAASADSNPASNELNIGIGTGTSSIKGADDQPGTGLVFAAAGAQLGTISKTTGVFSATGAFGTAGGVFGIVTVDDVNGLSFDPSNGYLYGVENRAGDTDLLFRADPATGAIVADAFGVGVDYVEIQGVGSREEASSIAIHPSTGVMYAGLGDDGGGQNQRFVTIDKATGATATVGDTDPPILVGLDFTPAGVLWAVGMDRSSPTEGYMYGVDITDASIITSVRVDNGSSYEALAWAFEPPPAPNNPPVAVDDSATAIQDAAVIVSVLANDTDPDSDPLSLASFTQGANGTVSDNGDDTVTYTPDPAWTGVDTFTYEASDGNGGLDTATVTVTVLEKVVLKSLQKGSATLSGASPVSAAITEVDPSRSFLVFSVRENLGDPDDGTVTGRLASSTSVVFERIGSTGTITIEWSVVEFTSGVTVQRGTAAMGANSVNVPITAIDLTRSFPIVSMRTGGTV